MTPYEFIKKHAHPEDIIICNDGSRWHHEFSGFYGFKLRNLKTGEVLSEKGDINRLFVREIRRLGAVEPSLHICGHEVIHFDLIAVYSSEPSPKEKLGEKIKDMKKAVLEAEEEYRKL